MGLIKRVCKSIGIVSTLFSKKDQCNSTVNTTLIRNLY